MKSIRYDFPDIDNGMNCSNSFISRVFTELDEEACKTINDDLTKLRNLLNSKQILPDENFVQIMFYDQKQRIQRVFVPKNSVPKSGPIKLTYDDWGIKTIELPRDSVNISNYNLKNSVRILNSNGIWVQYSKSSIEELQIVLTESKEATRPRSDTLFPKMEELETKLTDKKEKKARPRSVTLFPNMEELEIKLTDKKDKKARPKSLTLPAKSDLSFCVSLKNSFSNDSNFSQTLKNVFGLLQKFFSKVREEKEEDAAQKRY